MKLQVQFFFFFCLVIVSCRKDRIEKITSGSLNPKQIQTEEGSEGLMEFAAPTANP